MSQSILDGAKVKNIKSFIATSYFSNKVILICGDTGIGKTEITRQVYDELGVKHMTVEWQKWAGLENVLPVSIDNIHLNSVDQIRDKVDNLLKDKIKESHLELNDLADLKNKMLLEFHSGNSTLEVKEELALSKFNWMEDAIRDGVKVIIFDNIHKIPTNVYGFLQLFTDRYPREYNIYTGENKVPDDMRLICLGNYNSNSTEVKGTLTSGIINRIGVVEFEFDPKHWLEWAMTAKYPNGDRKIDLKTWAFLKAYPMYINSLEDASQGVIPTPRSWVWASDYLNTMKNDETYKRLYGDLNVEGIMSIASFVGVKAAKKYTTYIKSLGLYSTEDILKSKPKNLQEQVLFSVILSTNTNESNIDKILPYIKNNIKSPDVVEMYAKGVNDTEHTKGKVDVNLLKKMVKYFGDQPENC